MYIIYGRPLCTLISKGYVTDIEVFSGVERDVVNQKTPRMLQINYVKLTIFFFQL